MPPLERIALILNDGAGSANREEVRRAFERSRFEAEILTIGRGSATELARSAVERGFNIVAVGGGDGTVGAVAGALADTESALGVLPLGTLNHFAKDLRIPLDLDGAVRNLSAGKIESVDVGEVNGRVFVNNSSIGLYPQLVRDREAGQRTGHSKWVAFALGLVSVMKRYPFVEVAVKVGDRDLNCSTPFVFVGNNEYHGASGRESLQEGRLSLYIAHRAGRARLLLSAFLAVAGRPNANVDVFHPEEFFIASKHKHLHVATDGEVTRMKTPLRYRIRPRALRVIVPEN